MTSSILDWSTTAASNATADADINWQENQSPDTVNDSSRTMMARVAEWIKDSTPQRTSTGAANVYTVTSTSSPSALVDGFQIAFKAHQSNTGASTLAVNSFGAKPLRSRTGVALTANEILSGAAITAQYNSAADEFLLIGGRVGNSSADTLARIIPVGFVAPWPTATAPAGWLLAYGQAVSRTTYAELFAAYGTTYGSGDGSTTFNLPDYRGRTPFGKDDMGGSAAGRITSAASGVDGATLGATGGDQKHTLTSAQIPAHTHTATVSITSTPNTSIVENGNSGTVDVTSGSGNTVAKRSNVPNTISSTGTVTVNNTGGGGAHNNMPPAIIQNWIILALPAAAAAANLGVNGYYYQWSTTTTDTDPGTGKLGFNNSTLASATQLYISESDQLGNGMAPVLATWDDSTSATKGTLYVYKVGQLSTFAVFTITSTVTDGGSYDKFTVAHVTSNGTFADGDQLAVLFTPVGDKGDTGPTGSDGGVAFTFDSSTTMGAPSAGGLRLNNATLGSVTEFAIANTTADSGNPSVSGWINSWDDSTTTAHRGQITIRKAVPSDNILILDVTSAITDNSTWLTGTVSVIASNGSFSNGDALLVSFARTGDKGLDGAGSGTVTGVTAGAGLSSSGVGSTGGSITVSGTLTQVEAVNAQTGTTYTVLSGDHTKLVTFSNSSAVAVTLPQATSSFGAGWYCDVVNVNSGVVTITPTTSTINGASSLILNRFESVRIVSDGTNWQVKQGGVRGNAVTVASASTANIGAVASHVVSITGTTTITSFGSVPNQVRFGTFAAALTLTHNATSLILPSGASITTAAGDSFIAVSDSSGNWRVIAYTKADGTAVVGGSGGAPSAPQGRLTLTTATPVMTSTTSGQTTVYYTPYVGQYVPLYNGTSWTMTDVGGELSQATTDSTKSPAACTTNTNYDLFVWNDSGTYRCTRGPAWSSDTARGTGAGTTELQRMTNGLYTNKNAITNGPAANRGTYVGTIRTNGSSQVDFIVPSSAAAGGTAGVIGIWNAYNQDMFVASSQDSTDSWSYTTASWRASNNSSTMRTSFVTGLAGGIISATFAAWGISTTTPGRHGIGYDSTTAKAGVSGNATVASSNIAGFPFHSRPREIGWHYLSAIEFGGTGATFYGDSGSPSEIQNGLEVRGSY